MKSLVIREGMKSLLLHIHRPGRILDEVFHACPIWTRPWDRPLGIALGLTRRLSRQAGRGSQGEESLVFFAQTAALMT